MTLSDIRDYIETLTQGTVYVGPIPDKPEKIVGVYNSKHQHEYKVALSWSPTVQNTSLCWYTGINPSVRPKKPEKPCLKLSEPPEMQL